MIEKLDSAEAKSIEKSKNLLKSSKIPDQLFFIQAHLSFLPATIKRLEENGLPVVSALEIMEKLQGNLSSIPGDKGKNLQEKLQAVLDRNPGYKTLQSISKALQGDSGSIPPGMKPEEAAWLKFCPVVTADVERSFSKYKLLVTERRLSLLEENVSKMMVVNWFYNRQNM